MANSKDIIPQEGKLSFTQHSGFYVWKHPLEDEDDQLDPPCLLVGSAIIFLGDVSNNLYHVMTPLGVGWVHSSAFKGG